MSGTCLIHRAELSGIEFSKTVMRKFAEVLDRFGASSTLEDEGPNVIWQIERLAVP